ncbi:fluoride efflux transporter FluC [Halosegnis longus]|uniref:Fluoride-specific ion channel FluC n=1 Tax=Halosegnis longus TaxID=2216012 RepID=A0AAJ4RAA2_9EURY|nr:MULTISPECIES: CrcB family protein [Halobacteriales]RNJ27451.1 CrcB family protein [Salella cibi]
MTLTPLLVAVGGAVGAVCRHVVDEHIGRARVDTLVVNVLGSLLLGFVLAAPLGESAVALAGTGFCGAFTTFSSFAFETVRLAEDGFGRAAAVNAVGTFALAAVGVAVGGWGGSVVF